MTDIPAIQKTLKRDIPGIRQTAINWEAIYQELLLRLEKTSDTEALFMEFDTSPRASNCRNLLRGRFARDNMSDKVNVEQRKIDGKYRVYISWSSKNGRKV